MNSSINTMVIVFLAINLATAGVIQLGSSHTMPTNPVEVRRVCEPMVGANFTIKWNICVTCDDYDRGRMNSTLSANLNFPAFKFSCPAQCFRNKAFEYCDQLMGGQEVIIVKLD